MKPDTSATGSAVGGRDAIDRAHLKSPLDTSHVMFRYESAAPLHGLVSRFWIPVWSVPPGQEAPQHVLQYPVCLVVVTPEYSRFYGVVSGLSTTTLVGDGWATGVMLAPAGGFLVSGVDVSTFTDRFVPLEEVVGEAGRSAAERIRAAMARDPSSEDSHRASMGILTGLLEPFTPVDVEGDLVNRVVAFVESHPDVLRVEQVRAEFALSERALQRLVRRRIGLTPKWLIQRRRLQEAAERLREHTTSLAAVAADLGYADQAHFSRDFSRVTGTTPGAFAARYAT